MKQFIYLCVVLLFLSTIVSSCKEDDSYDAPVIYSIMDSPVDTAKVVEVGTLGSWVVIHGANFYDVESVYFNDVKVSLSALYIEPNLISVAIPRDLPKELTRKVMITTRYGVATKDLDLNIPPLVVNGLLNEYAKPGTDAFIKGENFDIYQIDTLKGAWVEINGKKLKVTQDNSTTLRFKLPEDITPNTDIYLYRKDEQGDLRVNLKVPGKYMDNQFVFVNFNTKVGDYETTDGLGKPGYPEAIEHTYCALKGEFKYWEGKWEVFRNMPIYEEPSFDPDKKGYTKLLNNPNVKIAFEVNVLKEWVRIPLYIVIDGYEYKWQPYGGVSFITQGWQTIRIPITELKKAGASLVLQEDQIRGRWYGRVFKLDLWTPDRPVDMFVCIDNVRFTVEE